MSIKWAAAGSQHGVRGPLGPLKCSIEETLAEEPRGGS